MMKKMVFAAALLALLGVIYVFTDVGENDAVSRSSLNETTELQTHETAAREDAVNNISGNTNTQNSPTAAQQTKTDKTASDAPKRMADFDPNANYTYSSTTLTHAINGLEQLNQLRQSHSNITEEDVQDVWQKIDAAVAENTISPIESMKHKRWLVSLVDSTRLQQQFDSESTLLANQLQAAAITAREAQANDPQFLAYKKAEAELTKEILAKYPDDKAKAAKELGTALDKVRAEIYH